MRVLKRVILVTMLLSLALTQSAYAGIPAMFHNYRVNNYAGDTEAYVNDPAGAGEKNFNDYPGVYGTVNEPTGGDNVSVEIYGNVDCKYTGTNYYDITNGMNVASTNPTTSTKTWYVKSNDIEMTNGNEHLSLIGAMVQGQKVNFHAGNVVVNNQTGSTSSYGLDLNDGNTTVKNLTVNGNPGHTTVGANVYNSAELTVEENLTVNDGTLINIQSGTGNVVNILGTADDTSVDYILIKAANEDDITLNVWKTEGDVKFNDAATEYSDSKVNYIIKDKDGSVTYSHMTLSGVKPLDISDRDGNVKHYYTAAEGTITVTLSAGYKLGSTTDFVRDGQTYTVTIPQGGGVTLEAILEAVQRQISGGSTLASTSSGWKQSGSNWQYVKADGSYAKNEWVEIEVNGVKRWYHFGDDTMMDTGWFRDADGSWYYLSKEEGQNAGSMQTGWMTDPDDGHVYYLDPVTGKMAIGWTVIDGKKYYFCEGSDSESGWTQDEKAEWVYEKRNVIPLGALIKR